MLGHDVRGLFDGVVAIDRDERRLLAIGDEVARGQALAIEKPFSRIQSGLYILPR
jgi:hypothetical protein